MTKLKTVNRPIELDAEEQFYDNMQIDYTQTVSTEQASAITQAAQNKRSELSEKKALSFNLPRSEREKFKHISESEGLKFQTKLKQVVYLLNRGYQIVKKDNTISV